MKQYLVIALILASLGCDGGDLDPLRPDAQMPMTGPETTYYEHVSPLVARECLGCHVEGGIGPFPLDSYDAIVEVAEYVEPAVMTGYMPPWMPDRSCREFEHQRGLIASERDTIVRWIQQGLLRGDPADQPPLPAPPPAFEATHVARMAEAYTPNPELPDDYRCFVLDHVFERDTFLTGRTVVPGARELVHHVLVYGVSADAMEDIEAADAADAGPGYTCFAGPIPSTGDSQGGTLGVVGMGGWVPGQIPFLEREGRAVYLPAGTRIVMQIHYNTLSDDPAPDMTEYHMRLTEEPPEQRSTTFPLVIQDLDIRAGAPENLHRRTFRSYRSEPVHITGFTPHMHLLGTEIGLTRVPAIGASAEPECMIDVPRWDFSWQQSYRVREDQPIDLLPGEGLELRCQYDNSPSNQPVVNGEQVEPRDVTWGEGTLDEMCLLYVQEELPWTGVPAAGGCEAAEACLGECATDDTQCLLDCEGIDFGCRICTLQSTSGCARDTCLPSFAPAAACFDTCILSYVLLGGSFDRCMATECPTTWDAARSCIAGVVEAGTCDAQLAGCGISR